ncbi:MAG: BTAD domain-containing putative transcriptional regulator, partial [Stackebrandtia sp.]
MRAIRFGVLGPLTVHADGDDVSPRAGMQLLLLAVLLSRARKPVSPQSLIGTLWPDVEPDNAAKTLQIYVHRLRKLLGDSRRVTHSANGYTLVASRSELDWQLFEDLVRTARQAHTLGDLDQAQVRYDQALALWRGEPYADVGDVPVLLPEIERLDALRTDARIEQAETRLARGGHLEVVDTLAQLCADEPYREELYRLLMLARYRSGRPAEALAAYQQARERIGGELGLDLSPRLRRLHRAVLNRDPALDLASDDQSDSAGTAGASPPAQLPSAVVVLAGRDEELRVLVESDEPPAVAAIDGMAGVGKTALAVTAAHRLSDRCPDGQLFVDLRGFTPGVRPLMPTRALEQLLHSVGVSGEQTPADLDSRAALWRSRLHDKRMLILLDNALNAEQVRPLLPASSGCLTLITSRTRMTDLDEATPLSLDALAPAAAQELFEQVAGEERMRDESPEALEADVA